MGAAFDRLMPNGAAEFARIKAELQAMGKKPSYQGVTMALVCMAIARNRAEAQRTIDTLTDMVAELERRVTNLEARVAQLENADDPHV